MPHEYQSQCFYHVYLRSKHPGRPLKLVILCPEGGKLCFIKGREQFWFTRSEVHKRKCGMFCSGFSFARIINTFEMETRGFETIQMFTIICTASSGIALQIPAAAYDDSRYRR